MTLSTIRPTIDLLQVQRVSSGFLSFLSSCRFGAATNVAIEWIRAMRWYMRPSHMRSTTTKLTTSLSRPHTTRSQVWCSLAWCRELTIFPWESTPTCKINRCLHNNSSNSINSQALCKWLHLMQSKSTPNSCNSNNFSSLKWWRWRPGSRICLSNLWCLALLRVRAP